MFMITNKKVALEISNMMIEFGGRINESIALVKDNCASEEFEQYRNAAGNILGEMLLEIMNPIYVRFPEIKPKELK